jgi:small subunit ribosomal protein S6
METARTVPAHRAREYETIYILRPNAGEEAAEKVAARVVETIAKMEGKLVEVDVWGRRRLAYRVKGNSKGVFIYLRYLGYPGLVYELERNLRMLDAVMKHQTVKMTDEIDPSTVEVDPEAIKFTGMDFSEEPEEELPAEDELLSGGAEASYLDYEPESISSDDEDEDEFEMVDEDHSARSEKPAEGEEEEQ